MEELTVSLGIHRPQDPGLRRDKDEQIMYYQYFDLPECLALPDQECLTPWTVLPPPPLQIFFPAVKGLRNWQNVTSWMFGLYLPHHLYHL